MMDKLGGIAFVVGLILAALIALFSATAAPVWAVFTLGILGLLVGLLNIADKETITYLVASITFLLSFQALSDIITGLAFGWDSIAAFFALMVVFVAPAAAVVAVKALFDVSRD